MTRQNGASFNKARMEKKVVLTFACLNGERGK